ncbi:nuclear pore complex NUP98A isoform B [Micractinium conductrix]|uniref:Nucleoporin autopeptidase n=1 Tax=Micractinium conductrix TaxID=554055 RepID=A0A2P6VS21_9CHLO|nr:nuclear pore complex NUP98A isoform B [Micractinium conductrix]|eukprot:PSC76893.1 nuclear pore complex NUP98A isoform B [Micractinium conductrix]
MSFGFGGGGFGAASSPFGAASPSPFGQQTPAFGQNTSPFGATTSTGVFGQSQPAFGATPTPAFGASPALAFGATSAPAFGAASTPAFGAAGSAFGAKPAFGGFGASAASPFGASSAPAFGQPSAPAFGAASTPAFGASPFGGGSTFGLPSAPAFGVASMPAFGASSSPGFGQPGGLTAFGSTAFGAGGQAAGGFGAGGFGAGGARGTRAVPWRKTQEQDTSGSTGAKSVVFFNSISCMPEYAGKSVEELRWEDWQDGCKGNTGAASPAGGAFGNTTTFGAAASSPFGAPASSPGFGAASSPGFGATAAPAFGAASTPAFGGFGAASAPAFGAASAPAFGGFGAASSSPFGGASPSPFGQSAPAFGATSTPAFGATSSPAFGATSAPAFGGFGAASAPAFGASPTPAFGASSTPGFGFGATSAPAFGASSTPAFGATSTPSFGFGAASTPGFGAASAPSFGAASSPSLFGASSTPAFGGGSLFGGAQQQKPATGFGFGAASTPAFGATGTSLFGGASTPAFGIGGGLFGASQSAPSFSFTPAQPAAGTAPAGALVQAQQVQAPGVATSPYGVLPEPPRVSPAPEYKVGLTQRPAGLLGGGPPRPAALITPRSITPRSGVRMRPRRSMSATRMSRSPADFLAAAQQAAGAPGGGGDGRGGSATPNGTPNMFVPRENPRRLFVRDPLPSTEGAGTSTASPAMGAGAGAGATPGRPPLRTPGSGLRITPGGRRADGLAAAGANGSAGGAVDGGFVLAENGFGPAGGGADGALSDAQLSAMLPSLKQPDYYTEPSLQQLAAMARDDPACLAEVANFVVGRRGVGSVRWLEPTDVRGLDLDASVQLSKGSIEVYLDESQKPEVGRGLNKPAEVTMLRILKLDKESGRPTADPEAIDRFTRKLKKVTAEQGARFVSYDAASGTWRFEVEHFSRYGLADSEDEDEEPAGGAGAGAADGAQRQQWRQQQGGEESSDDELQRFGVGGRRRGSEAARRGEGAAGSDDEEAMEESLGRGGSEASGGEQEEEEMDEDQGGDGRHQELSFGVGFGADGGAGGSRALQLSLPASLGMEPEDLQRIRDGLYAGSQQARQPPAKQRRTLTVGVAPAAAPAGAGFASAAMPAAALGAPARPALAARNAWRKQQAAPVRPPEGHPATAPSTPPPAGLPPLLPAGPTPVSSAAASGKQCLLRAPGPEAQRAGAERCLPDAGQYGGAAFRAGWAPNGVLAHAGGRASSAAHVVVRQLSVGARVAPPGEPADADSGFQQRQRKALEAALTLHMQHSRAEKGSTDDEDGDEDCTATAVVPRWRLRCRREGELRKLSLRYIELCNAAAAEAQGLERTVLRHQATTWELLHVLFSAIAGEAARSGVDAAMEGQEAEGELQLDRLAAFKRRAQLSHWLRDRAGPHVEAALRGSGGAPAGATTSSDAVAAQLLALLSGHQLAAAAALAAASGNPRLGTLLAQAGARGMAVADLAAQLRVWEESGCERHISEALRRVYALLAGHVDEVTPSLGLDWRRALGLHLWYGCQPTATVSDALDSYASAVEAGAAPPPLPLYAEQAAGSGSGGSGPSGGAFDVAFELLRLHAVAADPDASGFPAALAPLLARLLRPAGVTPDPLDSAFCWHLLSVLSAVEALPEDAAALPPAAAARMSFIAQLETGGGLAHWAVYAALHIPGADERDRVVRELLLAHADEWADDDEVQAFLRDVLRLPPAWLAEAAALWARYCQDDAGRLDSLLAAGDWSGAHSLLCDGVAPRWLLAGATHRLSDVLQLLGERAAEVNAAGGAGAWEAGGAVYSAYLYLRDLYGGLGRSSSEAPPALDFSERMEAASRLAGMLQDAGVRWGLAGEQEGRGRRLDARPGGGAAQQAVYARMAAELSRWVLSDSAGEGAGLLPQPRQALLAVQLRGMPHESAAASLQLAAVNLAQRVA